MYTNLDGNHIIQFALGRWGKKTQGNEKGLTKKALATKYLFCCYNDLCRPKPPTVEPAIYYNGLFKVESKPEKASSTPEVMSAAMEFKENGSILLRAFKDYLESIGCINEAKFIDLGIKNNLGYKKIICEVLMRTNMHVPIEKTQPKSVDSTPDGATAEDLPERETSHNHSIKQIREDFIRIVEHYEIMEIINRESAILYRMDATKLDICSEKIFPVPVLNNLKHDDAILYTSIKSFSEKLYLQTTGIVACLNRNFDSSDKTASINMKEPADISKMKLRKKTKPHRIKKPDSNRRRINRNYIAIPNISNELIDNAYDPLPLMKMAVEEWSDFCRVMNILYEEIRSSK